QCVKEICLNYLRLPHVNKGLTRCLALEYLDILGIGLLFMPFVLHLTLIQKQNQKEFLFDITLSVHTTHLGICLWGTHTFFWGGVLDGEMAQDATLQKLASFSKE
ncbi:hypothetical protein ACJX0J_013506, partial [Zea mays]